MAINFAQIKSLTIPDGSVIKITDSNGVVLYNQTQYRELEYIHFSGAEYVDTGYQPTNTTQFTITAKFIDTLVTAYNGKGYMGARNRYAIGHNIDGTYFFGLGSWVTTSISCDTTDFHTISIRPDGFATNIGYKIDNGSWTNPGNVSFVNGGTGTCIIGGANSTEGVSSFIQEYVSSVILIENTTEVRNCKPVQRKSDNVCGLYDTVNNVFYPMQGTNITTAAAGATVDENPNWSPTLLMNSYSNAGGSGTIFAVTTGSTPAETNTLLTFNQDPSYLILTCTLYHGSVGGTGTKFGAIWVTTFDNESSGTYIINNSSNSSDTQTVTSVKIQLKGSGVKTFAGCRGTAGGYTSSVDLQYDKDNHVLQVYRHGATQASTACRISNITIEAYY